METIKLSKFGKNVILVMDDTIYHRRLSSSEEEIYDDIEEAVEQIRSGALSADEYASHKKALRAIMNSRPFPESKEQKEIEERISKQTFELAEGDYDLRQRLERAERIASLNENLEHDLAGYVYLKGHSIPMPQDLVDAFMDATYNPTSSYTVESLENFWKWAVLNPNPEARNDLFSWFKTGEFTITDEGMVVAYRYVNVKQKGDNDAELWQFVKSSWEKIRAWKKSPKNHNVYQDGYGDYKCSDKNLWDGVNYSEVGNLDELYDNLSGQTFGKETIYTDAHTGTFNIKLGEEVSMEREDCDQNRNAQCSSGLHFMSRKYYGAFGSIPIVILVNPMNIVAFPSYDQTKGRTCRYLPVAIAEKKDNGKLKTFDPGTLAFNYAGLERNRMVDIAFEKGFEGMIKSGLISSEVSFTDFSFVRGVAKKSLENKVVNVE